MGQALYPHPQWERLTKLWASYYPLAGLDEERRRLLTTLQISMPGFVALLANHRPPALHGRSLLEVLEVRQRQPARLVGLYQAWGAAPWKMYHASPSLVFAVLGQARADGKLSPETESAMLMKLLTHWALRATLDASELCADRPRRRPTRFKTTYSLTLQ